MFGPLPVLCTAAPQGADPDRRIMKHSRGGFDPSYNAQAAVGHAAHIIAAVALDNAALDANWLLPMIDAAKGQPGRAAYRKRKWIAEPTNGWITSVLEFVSSVGAASSVYAPIGDSSVRRRTCGEWPRWLSPKREAWQRPRRRVRPPLPSGGRETPGHADRARTAGPSPNTSDPPKQSFKPFCRPRP